MVTTFYPPYHFGGEAIFVQALARALALEGHHVEVVHSEDSYCLRGVGARRIVERYTLLEGADDAPAVVPVPLSMNSKGLSLAERGLCIGLGRRCHGRGLRTRQSL